MNSFLETVPKLHPDSKWNRVNEDEYFLYNETFDSQMKISLSAAMVLECVDGVRSIKDITDKLTDNTSTQEDYENIYNFICSKLKSNNILLEKGDEKVDTSSIYFEKMILRGEIVNPICKKMTFLFHPFFIWLIISLLISSLALYIFDKTHIPIQNSINPFIVGVGLILLVLAHEIGHCTALQYRSLNTKGIGFGFHFIFPVLFAEVTQAWALPHRQRIVVDLGGFYFQAILTLLFFVLAIFLDSSSLMNLVYISFFLFIFNINPFLKSDFYWTISDFYNLPNLHDLANNSLLKLYRYKILSSKDIGLVLFAVSRYVFLGFIVIFMLGRLVNSIIKIYNGHYIWNFLNIESDLLILIGLLILAYKWATKKKK